MKKIFSFLISAAVILGAVSCAKENVSEITPVGEEITSTFSVTLADLGTRVAGDADILLFPDIHSGNLVYKSIVHMVQCKNGNILTGTQAPVILTSRSDDCETKVNSIALAAVVAEELKKNK